MDGYLVLFQISHTVLEQGKLLLLQLRIQGALTLAANRSPVSWVDVNAEKMEGVFKVPPERDELPQEINENLIVELYSK